jgi:ATP/maltotriose-dependent transcriptional regulator MalT
MQALMQANRLVDNGKLNEAGAEFARLADELGGARPRQAANLHAAAAHAFVGAGAAEQALQHAVQALQMFQQYHMLQRFPVFFANITHKMQDHGMHEAAQKLESEFGMDAQQAQPDVVANADVNRHTLPAVCPHCGGAVRSDEVEWIDAVSAECIYCGGIIQAVR